MIDLKPPFRLATAEDADALARFVNWAGRGMPEYLWGKMAKDGQDPWDVGRARQSEKASEGQIVVIDEGNGPVSALTGYAIGAEPEPTAGIPAMFVPLQDLENLVPNSWYVNVLATLPEHRGKGHGHRLLALAEDIAADLGLDRMSIVTEDTNLGALRLYHGLGYVETARRDLVRDGWDTDFKEWVLLLKTLR